MQDTGLPARGTTSCARHPIVLAAVGAGLVLRLLFGFAYWTGKPLTLDEQEYLLLAHNLAAGRGFVYTSPATGLVEGRHVGRAPLYPLFLAALGRAVPGSAITAPNLPASTPAEIKAAQAAVGALTVWLIALVAGRLAGRRAAVTAAIVAAVYPPLVWIGSYVLSETMYTAMAIAGVWLVDRTVAGESRRAVPAAAWAGVLGGLATLARPAMLVYLGFAGAWLAWRRRPALVAALTAGALLVVLPWTARNFVETGRLVLVASEGGVTFWTGNNPLAMGEGDLAVHPPMKRAALEIERQAGTASLEELEAVYYRNAIEYIRAHPVEWLGLLARKAFYTVVPIGPSYRAHSTRYFVASLVSYLLVLPFGLVGAYRLARSTTPPIALFLLAASSLVVCIVFFPQERFRIPVIDPTLIVCAGVLPFLPAPPRAAGRQVAG